MNTLRLSQRDLRRLSVAWRPDKFQKLIIRNLPAPKPEVRVRRLPSRTMRKRRPVRKTDPFRLLAPLISLLVIVAAFMSLVIVTKTYLIESFEVAIERPAMEAPVEPLETMPEETSEEQLVEAPAVEEVVQEKVELIADKDILSMDEVMPPVDCASMIPTIPQPFLPETVALIKSPVVLKSVGGSARNFGGRVAAMKKYGGTGAGEDAVLRALRYLKSLQRENGSWRHKGEGDATAFALLAFLAHGEDFASPEFGETVKKAVEYLLEHHRSNMATYALAEAAAVIRTPVLGEAAAVAVSEMCQRQKEVIKANAGGVIPRYCAVMAMVSAKLAQLKVPELEATMKNFTDGYLEMRDLKAADWTKIKGEGVWHYMIASVCLQYLQRGRDPASRALLAYLDRLWPPATLGTTEIACCPVRSNYFSTMMFFNDGGEVWKRWNDGMIAAYVKTQIVEGALGYWRCQDKHIGEQPFWTTAYIAQQLMVYYRYLPTNSEEAWKDLKPKSADIPWPNWTDIEVDI